MMHTQRTGLLKEYLKIWIHVMVCQYFLKHFFVNYDSTQVPDFLTGFAWCKTHGGKRFCELGEAFLDAQTSCAVS